MKQLQRLLILQGHKCFFCGHRIPDGQASVEHLHALSNDGKKSDDNSVVCCKDVNTALGNLSVKKKFEVVLSNKGASACFAPVFPALDVKPEEKIGTKAKKLLPKVRKNLLGRGTARPKTVAKLKNSLTTTFKKASPKVIDAVMELLKTKGYTEETDGKLSYPGLESGCKKNQTSKSRTSQEEGLAPAVFLSESLHSELS